MPSKNVFNEWCVRRQNKFDSKIEFVFWLVETFWENEKVDLLVIRIFSFSQNVFKSLLLQGSLKLWIVW